MQVHRVNSVTLDYYFRLLLRNYFRFAVSFQNSIDACDILLRMNIDIKVKFKYFYSQFFASSGASRMQRKCRLACRNRAMLELK